MSLQAYFPTGDYLRAHGRAPIFDRAFTLGTTKPTADNSGHGSAVLRTPAQAGLATELNGDIIVTDAYHAARAVMMPVPVYTPVRGVNNRVIAVVVTYVNRLTLLIDRVNLAGFLKVRTRHMVWVRQSRVRGSGYISGATRTGLIDCNHGDLGLGGYANVLVDECTLVPDAPCEGVDGIVGHDYTLVRPLIRNVVDHFGWFNSVRPNDPVRVMVLGGYMVDLAYFTFPEILPWSDKRTHNDGGQGQGNPGPVVIFGPLIHANASATAGNGLDPNASPAPNTYRPSVTGQGIGLTPNVSSMSDIDIARAWLDFGAQTITGIDRPGLTVTGLRIFENKFGRNQPDLLKNGTRARRAVLLSPGINAPGLPTTTGPDTQNGNVWEDTGAPIIVHRFTDGT